MDYEKKEMTPFEIFCGQLAQVFFWVVLAMALYGCWESDTRERQGRAIDMYLNGRRSVIYLPPTLN